MTISSSCPIYTNNFVVVSVATLLNWVSQLAALRLGPPGLKTMIQINILKRKLVILNTAIKLTSVMNVTSVSKDAI